MKNEVYLRLVYKVSGQVFNTASKGSAVRIDPFTKRTFGFGTSDNFKHCIREVFKNLTRILEPNICFERKYSKDVNKNGKMFEQGQVFSEIDFENMLIIFGQFNPLSLPNSPKYIKAAIKASFDVGDFMPIHPLLCSYNNNEIGVRRGNLNSKIVFSQDGKKNNYAFTPEDIVNIFGGDEEDAKLSFKKEKKPYNFYTKNATSSGIYYIDLKINFEDLIKKNITYVEFTKDEEDYLISKGYGFAIDRGIRYLITPKDYILPIIKPFIMALISADFTSNRSTHGSANELLRIAVSANPRLVEQSTMAELIDDKTAKLAFIDGDNSEKPSILKIENNFKTYNSLALRQFITKEEGLITSIDATDNAIGDLIEYGETFIKNYEF